MRSFVIGMALVASGCTVERPHSLSDFACPSGACDAGSKPVRDGGVDVTKRDAGPNDKRDAGAGPDVLRVDTGVRPLPMCPGLTELPASGVAVGNTSMANNGYEGGCYPNGGKDAVVGFTVPGRLWFLEVTSLGSSFDTTVHFYSGDCNRSSQLVCADETDTELMYANTASFRLTDVPAGSYAAVIDGFMPDQAGDYILRVTGAVAPGEICDPQKQYLPCLIGNCAVEPDGVPRCPAVLDCGDSIDADRDGMVDEDAAECVDPPAVNCSAGGAPFIDRPAMPSASVTDNGTVTFREWTTESVPFGSYSTPIPRDQDGTSLLLDLDGEYRMRYIAADDQHQISACELTLQPVTTAKLRAELVWSPEKPRFASTELMFLHLLHPSADRWFHETLDCNGTDCFDVPLDWGRQGDFADDPLWVGFFYGPQRAYVEDPTTNGRYAFGVHLIDLGGQPNVEAYLRIFCGGTLAQSYGPVTLDTGAFDSQDQNDFWKIAQVAMNADGTCNVTPYGNGTNDIVRAIDAMGAR